MEIRTLRAGEREALLDLLDAWDVGDGWRGGRAFFRRYVEDDPTFRDANVHVAAEKGALLSCVQVFPRRLRAAGAEVPVAGIGSVFTRPEARGAGVARAVLECACRDARARGMPLGLLFAGPIPWYEAQGWSSWTLERHVARGAGRPADGARVRSFEAPRDLDALRALHEATASRLDGTVIRDDALWTASLRNAGNPDEDVLVAEDARGAMQAYGRATRLAGARLVTEWGHAGDGRDDDDPAPLADVLAALLPAGGVIPNLARAPAALPAALGARGLALEAVREPFTMLRVLDPDGLAARLGAPPPGRGEDANAWLAAQLPPARFGFWPADRF